MGMRIGESSSVQNTPSDTNEASVDADKAAQHAMEAMMRALEEARKAAEAQQAAARQAKNSGFEQLPTHRSRSLDWLSGGQRPTGASSTGLPSMSARDLQAMRTFQVQGETSDSPLADVAAPNSSALQSSSSAYSQNPAGLVADWKAKASAVSGNADLVNAYFRNNEAGLDRLARYVTTPPLANGYERGVTTEDQVRAQVPSFAAQGLSDAFPGSTVEFYATARDTRLNGSPPNDNVFIRVTSRDANGNPQTDHYSFNPEALVEDNPAGGRTSYGDLQKFAQDNPDIARDWVNAMGWKGEPKDFFQANSLTPRRVPVADMVGTLMNVPGGGKALMSWAATNPTNFLQKVAEPSPGSIIATANPLTGTSGVNPANAALHFDWVKKNYQDDQKALANAYDAMNNPALDPATRDEFTAAYYDTERQLNEKWAPYGVQVSRGMITAPEPNTGPLANAQLPDGGTVAEHIRLAQAQQFNQALYQGVPSLGIGANQYEAVRKLVITTRYDQNPDLPTPEQQRSLTLNAIADTLREQGVVPKTLSNEEILNSLGLSAQDSDAARKGSQSSLLLRDMDHYNKTFEKLMDTPLPRGVSAAIWTATVTSYNGIKEWVQANKAALEQIANSEPMNSAELGVPDLSPAVARLLVDSFANDATSAAGYEDREAGMQGIYDALAHP